MLMTLTAPWNDADIQAEISIPGNVNVRDPEFRVETISQLDENGDWIELAGAERTKVYSWLVHDRYQEIMDQVFEELADEWRGSSHARGQRCPVGMAS